MKISLECKYCGFSWCEEVYNESYLKNKTCRKPGCSDRNLIIRDISGKVDYYVGAKPFPVKTFEPEKHTYPTGPDRSEDYKWPGNMRYPSDIMD